MKGNSIPAVLCTATICCVCSNLILLQAIVMFIAITVYVVVLLFTILLCCTCYYSDHLILLQATKITKQKELQSVKTQTRRSVVAKGKGELQMRIT